MKYAEIDRRLSLLVRKRASDHTGALSCFTCGKRLHWKEAHAGHYMGRTHISTRWHPLNVHPQCPECNVILGGNVKRYAERLDEVFGEGTAEELRIESKRVAHFSQEDLKAMAAEFARRLQKL